MRLKDNRTPSGQAKYEDSYTGACPRTSSARDRFAFQNTTKAMVHYMDTGGAQSLDNITIMDNSLVNNSFIQPLPMPNKPNGKNSAVNII